MSGLDKLRNISSGPTVIPTVLSEDVIAQTVTARDLVIEGSVTFPDGYVAYTPSATTIRWTKTASGGETSLSGLDINNLSLSYDIGFEQVYLNGVLLVRNLDYIATSGTSIFGFTALSANDVIEVLAPSAVEVANAYSQAQSDAKYFSKSDVYSFKNKLINGDMRVNQRGTYSTTTNTYQYTTDRWWVFSGTSTVGSPSYVSSTGLTNFSFALRAQRQASNTGTAAIAVGQTLESTNVYALQGQIITLSFWARAGVNYSGASNALGVAINQGTGVDQGTLATINQTWTGQTNTTIGTATLTTFWKKFNYSYLVPDTATELALLFLYTAVGTAGANDYFDITGVQVEPGTVATPFEHRPIGAELALCQRYYYKITGAGGNAHFAMGSAASGAISYAVVQFPVSMRTISTSSNITSSGVAISDFTAQTTGGTISTSGTGTWSTLNSCLVSYSVVSGLTAYRPGSLTFTSSLGYLAFDTEL